MSKAHVTVLIVYTACCLSCGPSSPQKGTYRSSTAKAADKTEILYVDKTTALRLQFIRGNDKAPYAEICRARWGGWTWGTGTGDVIGDRLVEHVEELNDAPSEGIVYGKYVKVPTFTEMESAVQVKPLFKTRYFVYEGATTTTYATEGELKDVLEQRFGISDLRLYSPTQFVQIVTDGVNATRTPE